MLTSAAIAGALSACSATDGSDGPSTTTTAAEAYSRVALRNPCDAIPADLFAQQGLKPESVSLYPDNDQTLPNSSSNGCWVELSARGKSFSMAVTNRNIEWVRNQYSGMAKTDRTALSNSFDGRLADVSDLEGRSCMILIGVPGGTLKMEGLFATDWSADNCAHGVDLAKLFLPYVKATP
ncbi:DUF3558 family protein [Nocardia yamanashiensis]|uniref:DUF3558 family protein n=1 Tax=Nocardia yamanashiensis TaxID=209247 RepID=UPI001470EE71|nr:DUF3558 family protein [Nocardia yamanashiensis]